jgi:hypothetical protein
MFPIILGKINLPRDPLAFFDGSCEKGEGAGGEGSGAVQTPNAIAS